MAPNFWATQARHEMHLSKTLLSGAMEWICRTCGRQLRIHQPQDGNLSIAVLAKGDQLVGHYGTSSPGIGFSATVAETD